MTNLLEFTYLDVEGGGIGALDNDAALEFGDGGLSLQLVDTDQGAAVVLINELEARLETEGQTKQARCERIKNSEIEESRQSMECNANSTYKGPAGTVKL